jgi:hypothetical protein
MALNNNFKIGLYNLDIPLEERKKNIKVYNSVKYASAKLNISCTTLKRIITNKTPVYLEELKGNYAIRHIK